MPIRPFLDSHRFDSETIRIMGVAFEMARASNRFLDRPDITEASIGRTIVALAKSGECNVDNLCDGAIAFLIAAPLAKNADRPPNPVSDTM